MLQTPAKILTLEEFLQLPEAKPAWEYSEGQIIQKPMPQGKHSILQGQLVSAINAAMASTEVGYAFPELRCTFGDRSLVPDISVLVWDRVPKDQNGEIANTFALAPDWTIEILSPGQSQTKVTKNILHCLQHGSQMGWLIDPDEHTMLVYLPTQKPLVFDQPDRGLTMPEFVGDLNLTVADLFAWLLGRSKS